jgi:murein DD-endopeptidase MepM/ murein hydrolase activator NlpD
MVVSSSYQGGGYGNVIDVQHPDGSMTRYGHNNRLIASVGQAVKQGQHIADMGNTGRSTGPHLHFEIHPGGGSAVNPLAYLPR